MVATAGEIPQSLVVRMDKVIEKARDRPLRSDTNTPWVVMHAVVAFEKKIEVLDAKSKKKINAIDYLMKPIDIGELCQAVDKASRATSKNAPSHARKTFRRAIARSLSF